MNQCRYIPVRSLPKKASDEHVSAILKAIIRREIRITGTALNMVESLWKVRGSVFVAAVLAHIQANHRVFVKTVTHPAPGQLFFHANVRLFPDSESEEDDVYVEIRLCNGKFILICDAHPHYDNVRLPK